MKKLIHFTLIAALVCGGLVTPVHAEEPPASQVGILISELQTAGSQSATEEFVELYNAAAEPLDITGWQLQYRAASGTATQTWPASSTKATLACKAGSAEDCRVIVNPSGRLVLVQGIANIADALPMTGGFSSTGGQIRLVQPGSTPNVHDFVGYGTAVDSETASATAPSAGKSLKRVMLPDATLQDSQNNALDLLADCGSPTPGQPDTDPIPTPTGCENQTAEPPVEDPIEEPPNGDPPNDPDPEPPVYLPLAITEVFPDPKPPATDARDEFIELYNPHEVAVTLTGYQIQTGTGFRYTYTLGDTPLGPHRYLAIPSAVSHLSLANTSGSGVRLLDPDGQVVAEVPSYGAAKTGQSWIQHEGVWQWSTTPTAGTANVLTIPPPPAPKTAATTSKKKAAAHKPPKTTPPKTVKAPSLPKTASPIETAASAPKAQEPPYWIVIPLAAIIIAYAIYEYRTNIAQAWQRWRSAANKQKQAAEDEG